MNILRVTTFSPCRKYRYTLWRDWFEDVHDHGAYAAPQPDFVQFIGLNPSTADETNNDPTITRCMAFAKSWGFSAMCMTNIFAWRDTDPEKMRKVFQPVGPDNDQWLADVAAEAKLVVAAWGTHGRHMFRGNTVKRLMPNLHCLKKTAGGYPSHPLYLKGDLKPIPFN